MVWSYAVSYRTDHWITDFIINAVQKIDDFVYRSNLLQFVEIHEYPALEIISVLKVFKDKYSRLHYFTLSPENLILQFFENRNLNWNKVSVLHNSNYSNYRVLKILLNERIQDQVVLYFLPQVNSEIRNRLFG